MNGRLRFSGRGATDREKILLQQGHVRDDVAGRRAEQYGELDASTHQPFMDERAETLDQLQRDTGVEFAAVVQERMRQQRLTDIGTPMLTVPVRFRVFRPGAARTCRMFSNSVNSAALRSNSSSPECVRVTP